MPRKPHPLGRRLRGVAKHVRTFRNFPLTLAANLRLGPRSGERALQLRNGLTLVMDASCLAAGSNAIKDVVADDVYELRRLDPAAPAVIVDIGAHVGAFALSAALRCPGATIHAFEPASASYRYLCRNIARNGLTGRVLPHDTAVAGADGEVHLFSSRTSATRYSLYESQFLDTRDGAAQRVEAISLSTLFTRHGITTCDFLKLDCEGAEYEILFNAPETVIRRIVRVGMEYHEGVTAGTGAELERFWADHGFAMRRVPVAGEARLGLLLAEQTSNPGTPPP